MQIRGNKYPIAKINGVIKITKTEITTGTNASGIITNVYSDNENYATVEKVSGTTDKIKITGVAKGEATITAKYTDDIYATIPVRVKGNVLVSTQVENISDSKNVGTATAITNTPYAEGSSISLTAEATDEDYKFVGWYEAKDGGAEKQKSTSVSYSYAVPENATTVVLKAKFEKKPEPLIGYYIKKGNEYAIVFADRLEQAGTTVTWNESNPSSASGGSACTFPTLTDEQKVAFKTYKINGTYTDTNFGTKNVLEVENSTGEDRFMALALSDLAVNGTIYAWYNSAYFNMTDFNSTGGTDGKGSPTSRGFLKGKENTETMITKWNNKSYGSQDGNTYGYKDVWGQIQNQLENGWFIPSFEEWSAFGWAMSQGKLKEGVTSYSKLGFNNNCWSSSQCDKFNAWIPSLNNGYMDKLAANYGSLVRLATTY